MIEILFIFNCILVLFVLVKHTTNLSFLSLSYYYVVIFVFIGSYLAIDSNDWWLRNIQNDNIIKAFYITNIYLIVHSILLLIKKPQKINLPTNYIAGIELYIFPVILIISLVTILILFFPNSALKSLIIDGNYNRLILAELRGSASVIQVENKIIIYFQNIVLRYFIPFIFVYYTLVYLRLNIYKKWFYLSLIVFVFSSSLTLAKAPIIKVLLLILIIRIFLGYKVNITRNFIISLVLLIILYIFVMGESDIFSALNSISHRIFIAQYLGFPMTLEVFPNNHEYLALSGLSGLISKILGIEYLSFSRIVMEFGNPYGVEAGTAGFMSTFYLAEGYSYAGYFGIVLTSMIVLSFFLFLDTFTKKIKLNYLSASLIIFFIFTLSSRTVDSFSSIVLNYPFYILVFLIVILNTFNKKFLKGY